MDKSSDSCYERKDHSTSYFPSGRPYGEASILLLRHGLNFYTLFWVNILMTSDLNQSGRTMAGCYLQVRGGDGAGGWKARDVFEID